MGNDFRARAADLLESLAGRIRDSDSETDLNDLEIDDLLPKFAGVTGWPVEHSRSPVLHNYWLKRYGIEGEYLQFPVPPEAFVECMKEMQEVGLRGLNVTIPHKEAAFELVDHKTEAAVRAGAVNTVVFNGDGTLTGDCTDGIGFLANLRAHGVEIGGKALVLGAGGASRAICAALIDAGCDVVIANRTATRAVTLTSALGGGDVVAWKDWPSRLAEFGLLVNTTSLGMEGKGFYDWDKALAGATPNLVVTDIVYVPLMTPLLEAANRRRLKSVDGLGMLIEQARPGFHAWFGVMPDADQETRDVLLRTLD